MGRVALRKATAFALTLAVIAFLVQANRTGAGGATFNVDRTDDDVTATSCTAASNDCSLRGAIIAANSLPGEDVVVMAAATYSLSIPGADEDAALTGDIDITDSLRLVGFDSGLTTIDGGDIDRVFDIHEPTESPVNVRLVALVLREGLAPGANDGDGGAIRKRGSGLLDLNDVALTNNHADDDAGALYAGGGTLTIAEVVMEDNDAGDGGGAMIILGNTNADIERSTLSGNTSRFGGAIFNTADDVSIVDSTLSDNTAISGGGIWDNGGDITINRSTVRGNSATGDGGGLRSIKSLTVINSTISGNSAGSDGGGISNTFLGKFNPGVLTVSNSTITGNTADSDQVGPSGDGGGIDNLDGSATITGSILAGNFDLGAAEAPDCSGEITSGGYNLIGTETGCTLLGSSTGNIIGQNPMLGPLQNNGGPTETHALLPGSPAIDEGPSACPPPATDQRGFTRPAGDGCDIGSYEAGAIVPTPSPTPGPQQVAWGDHNCSGSVDPVDGLLNLRHDAGLPTETGDCPEMGDDVNVQGGGTYPWGDLDCSGVPDPVDGLKVLRFDAGLDVTRPDDCPDPGDTVSIDG